MEIAALYTRVSSAHQQVLSELMPLGFQRDNL